MKSPIDRLPELRKQYPNVMLAFRCGDFYEFFGDDAKAAAAALGLTLTTRRQAGTDDLPMAGFPYHQLEAYLGKLIHVGKRVAICEAV